MDKNRVIDVVKNIIDECNSTSCDYCDFSKHGDCILAEALNGYPCSIDIDMPEGC